MILLSGVNWIGSHQLDPRTPIPADAAPLRYLSQVEIDVRQPEGEVAVVAPRGRLDAVTAPELRERIQQLLDSGAARLVLDLYEISFMDSIGMTTLLSGIKRAREAGGDLRVARATGQIQMALTLSALSRIIRPYPSVDAALARFPAVVPPTQPSPAAGGEGA